MVAPEQASARKAFFPSSMGLSVLVPAETAQLRVRIAWGDYVPLGRHGELLAAGAEQDEEEDAIPSEREGRGQWRRVPREVEQVIPLSGGAHNTLTLNGYPNLRLVVSVRQVG